MANKEETCSICGSKWVTSESKDWKVFKECLELTHKALVSGCHCKDKRDELRIMNKRLFGIITPNGINEGYTITFGRKLTKDEIRKAFADHVTIAIKAKHEFIRMAE